MVDLKKCKIKIIYKVWKGQYFQGYWLKSLTFYHPGSNNGVKIQVLMFLVKKIQRKFNCI